MLFYVSINVIGMTPYANLLNKFVIFFGNALSTLFSADLNPGKRNKLKKSNNDTRKKEIFRFR